MVTIKAAAALTGLTERAIRLYEKRGLLQSPARTATGYRNFSDEDIFRLRQIKYFRELKFSLQEVSTLLDASQEEQHEAMLLQHTIIRSKLDEYRRAESILAAVLAGPNTPTGQESEKHRVAILALDLQNDILQGGALACKRIRNILQPLRSLFAKARSLGVPVFYICDWHYQDDPELKLWNDHMIADTWGAQIIDEVAPMPGDYIIRKNRFNGFVNTDLEEALRRLNVDTLLLTGWRSHVCVAQTAIEAFYRGYQVAIAEDGVDSTTQTEHEHGMSLMQINYGFETLPCESALETLLKKTTN